MSLKPSPGAAIAATFFLIAITASPEASASTDDACLLMTQAQVSAALGIPMNAGTHVTPTFLKTCTWTPTGGPGQGVKAVTLNLQTAQMYDGGKAMMQRTIAMEKLKGEPGAQAAGTNAASGLGDDAYYLDMGNTVSLLVKKGSGAFKIVIYGKPAKADSQSAEKSMAQQVLSKF